MKAKTRDRIKEFWEHGDDTYETVLDRILDFYEKNHKSIEKHYKK